MSDTTSASVAPGKTARALAGLLGSVADACLFGLAFLVPVWFLPFTLDIVELNKQTLLIALTMIGLIAWIGKALLEKTFSLSRSWLHLTVAAFLAGYFVVSLFSLDRYISLAGNVGQMQWAFATVAALVFFYTLAVNRVRSSARAYQLLLWFVLGSLVSALYGIAQMIGWFPFGAGGATGAKTFNTIGTINALGTFLVIPTVVASSLVLYGCTDGECALGKKGSWPLFWKIVSWLMIAAGVAVAIITDFWPTWASLIFGMAVMSAIPFIRGLKACRPKTIAFPIVVILLSIVFLIYPTPVNLGIPSEVAPSASHTLQVAEGALREMPLFGSGPGTWMFDYAKYRSIGANLSQFWTIRFERGLSSVLTMPAMLGIVGTMLWFLLVLSGIVKAAAYLVKKRDCADWHAAAAISAAWITTVFIAFVYNYNIAHQFAFWFLLALLGALVADRAFVWDERSKPWAMGLLSAALIIVGVGAVSVAWLAGQRLVADANYSESVKAFQRGDSIDASIKRLEAAIALNPKNDLYERNLSQSYLIRVGRTLEARPDEQGMKVVSADVDKAVGAANRATAIGPANVDNWSNLASAYQAISSFTRGADEHAISGYEEALRREPNNPSFMNEIGKLYILRSDAYRTLLDSPEESAKKDAEANVKAELDKALDWFNRAIATKSDYAEAYYNLGLVLERQGKLEESVATFEKLLSVNPQDEAVALQLAVLYSRANRTDEARALFEQIVISNPKNANARWFLATIYEGEKKFDLAIEQLKEIEKTNPENPQLKAKIVEVEKAKSTPAVESIKAR
jgi:tetratricopeptide (TPR) repeat protein